MTDPRTGPDSEPGQPEAGQTGDGAMGPGGSGAASTGASSTGAPRPGSASGSGAGTRPAGSEQQAAGESGGVTTASRTGQAAVPQQYGPEAGREYGGDTDYERAPRGMADREGSDSMIAATAGRSWGAVLLGGLALLAVGVMLLVWPSISLTIVAILIGAAIVAAGVVRLFEGFSARADESGGMRAAYIVIGLLAVIVGVYLIRHHAVSLFLVAFVTGLFFILHGVSDLGVAASGRGLPGRGLRAVLGVFSLGAGIIMIVWPSLTLTLLFLIVAAWLLFYGAVLCALAFGLRRAAKARPSAGLRGQPVAAGAR